MSPVFYLSDGFLANSSEPWRIPDPDDIPPIPVVHPNDPEGFLAYGRDSASLARPWAIPGTPGLEHRIGGLSKRDGTGNVSYAPQDHERMVSVRAEKVARLARVIPSQTVYGASEGSLLVLGWGSTYGAIRTAVDEARREGVPVSQAHLRYLNPFPANLGEVLARFDRVLLPEMNMGQLALLLRARFGREIISLPKVQGRPFSVREIRERIEQLI
jgi:2-oxoglutarate ferredoxin oxidoreductase subunit alpha